MSINILIVDDAIVARKMIKRHLTGSQYEDANIIEASSGEQGLELFNENRDVVMTDWNMPGMNGIEFVKEIRNLEQGWTDSNTKPIPIIMITTEGTIQKINQAKEEGANEYIVKPFSAEQLVDALERVLED